VPSQAILFEGKIKALILPSRECAKRYLLKVRTERRNWTDQ